MKRFIIDDNSCGASLNGSYKNFVRARLALEEAVQDDIACCRNSNYAIIDLFTGEVVYEYYRNNEHDFTVENLRKMLARYMQSEIDHLHKCEYPDFCYVNPLMLQEIEYLNKILITKLR